jgi:arginyl-tRNA synthetase
MEHVLCGRCLGIIKLDKQETKLWQKGCEEILNNIYKKFDRLEIDLKVMLAEEISTKQNVIKNLAQNFLVKQNEVNKLLSRINNLRNSDPRNIELDDAFNNTNGGCQL